METIDLGLIPFDAALAYQKERVKKVQAGAEDALILCQHPFTVTLGRKSSERNLFVPRGELERRGFMVVSIDRGGDVTLHAPGQLVIYPVIDLKRRGWGLREYLRRLEQSAVDLLADFDIVATGDDGNRGVWTGPRKIASIGIGLSRWVSYHGMALNVNNDLDVFKVMRPCGLDVRMTSLSIECGRVVAIKEVLERYEDHCARSW